MFNGYRLDTTGDSSPANWDDIELQAMYQDLQDWSYKDVQGAIIKLHNGGSFAPNSSQIIGMLNRLGSKLLLVRENLNKLKVVQLQNVAGIEHEWFELGGYTTNMVTHSLQKLVENQ